MEENENNPKIFFRHFFIFYIKVAVIHTLTYIVFGILFSNMFDYSSIYSNDIVVNFMRGFESPLTVIGPFLQPIRAIFIAIALFPLRKLIASKFGWFIVWLIFVCIGIIAAPSSAPSSIEGLIYTQLPIEFHLHNLPELLIQTFSFSIILWVVEMLPHTEKEFSSRVFFLKLLFAILYTMIGIFLTSICGIIIMNFLELDYNNAKLDRGTVSYLTTISILTIIISYSFADKVYKNKLWLFLTIPLILLLYILFPYGYNYLFNTVYNNNMSLIPYSLSAVLMSIIYYLIFVIIYGKLKNIGKKTDSEDKNNSVSDDKEDIKLIEINPDNNQNENKDDVKYIELNSDNEK
ncbi:hypothetical protein BHAMNSH16_03435 [Brachyspira hampsonii]|uniref:Uncharacterized protein n=2 Tax=Brachyspira hampsonii TaxID=1287055 RepID=A0AAC9TT52_9SPIR|nr:hypothetical protein [Brachyspira hampsonii]ASJ20752.1 hypothetical protein BHAMNSH16_03435 [Brachyspira hampsonii]MBW5379188.1 hypothetical protein [Brachyspira hampsonii]OEJ14278.1 hypothetical protein A9496_01900 [Brachyspira hampsonii]